MDEFKKKEKKPVRIYYTSDWEEDFLNLKVNVINQQRKSDDLTKKI